MLVVCYMFYFVYFAGITSGRGYAHGEVGIAYIDIECVRIIAMIQYC